MRDSFDLKKVQTYMVYCLRQEIPPRVGDLARNLGISRVTLTHWFHDNLGTTPSEYLRQARIAYAQGMLRGTALTTTAIGYRSGFGTRRTFYRSFRNQTAMSPAEFRHKVRETGPDRSGPVR
jgi:transcriptional regulator GlxA family with amidase domain